MFSFSVISGTAARDIITSARREIVDVVRNAYLTHHAGDSVNPNSYFLRFPYSQNARIIALPAYLGGEYDVAGLKWISSFPDNIAHNMPRASAVLLLNDRDTGYPFACLEAAQISAARTAASAVLGAEQLLGSRRAAKVAVVGAGVIARNIVDFFVAQDWQVREYAVYDTSAAYANALAAYVRDDLRVSASAESDFSAAVKDADVVVLATTAAEPYITDVSTFVARQVVLNISLRDLAPDIILGAHNIVDDVDHCLTANTSPHLAEQIVGNRGFIDGTISQVILSEVELSPDKPRIFSPFGLGVLDLAVGSFVYDRAVARRQALPIEGFFGETERWHV
jgi:N-[(2S)-2-amino-2-carboxyethyl]-L-glutamate dehydrogenase